MLGGTFKGDAFYGYFWPWPPHPIVTPVKGAKGGKVSKVGDQRPGVSVRRT